MSIGAMMKQELEQEQAATRKLLGRVPRDKFDWQPHEKSMTMQRLASHLAELPGWAHMMVVEDSMDVAPKDGDPYVAPNYGSVEEMLATFDENMSIFRKAADGSGEIESLHGARPGLRGHHQVGGLESLPPAEHAVQAARG